MSISGNGKGHSACSFWAIIEIVLGIATIVIFNRLAVYYGITTISVLGFSASSKNDWYNYFSYSGNILGIAYFVFAFLIPIAISKTRITVYHDRVEGAGVSKWFFLGDVRTFNFLYPIEQVSMELNGGKLVVHGQNTYYCVYVKNGTEIQNALWEVKKGNNVSRGETVNMNNTTGSVTNYPPITKDDSNVEKKKCQKCNNIVPADVFTCPKCNGNRFK